MSKYIILQEFRGDDGVSAIQQASAWLTIQGKAVELDTVVGDHDFCSVFYKMPTQEESVFGPGTSGSISATSTGSINLMQRAA